jgi:hypothetical protein
MLAVKLDVREPLIDQVLLMALIKQINNKQEGMDRLLESGVPGELIDRLRVKVTMADVDRMGSAHCADIFAIAFNPVALETYLDNSERRKRDEQIKEYLAQHGASTELLCKWFSLPRSEADALRAAMAPLMPPGRPKLPGIKLRDQIHAAWPQISRGHPEREAYYELHQRFSSVGVASLYQTIIEHDPKPPKGRGPAAS